MMQTLEDAVAGLMPDLLRMARAHEKKIAASGVDWKYLNPERRRRIKRIDAVIEAYKNREMDRLIESTLTHN